MRIASQDRATYIDLERREESGYLLLDVTASLGEFRGSSRSHIIEDAPGFLRELAAFEANRKGMIALRDDEGQFELRIMAYDKLGHLWVGLSLRHGSTSPRAENVEPNLLSGGFVFDADHALRLFAELRELLGATR